MDVDSFPFIKRNIIGYSKWCQARRGAARFHLVLDLCYLADTTYPSPGSQQPAGGPVPSKIQTSLYVLSASTSEGDWHRVC